MLDPAIKARVDQLVGAGTPTGDAIGQAVAELDLRANPPQWVRDMLVEPGNNPEEKP
jgi:hypothetical protein